MQSEKHEMEAGDRGFRRVMQTAAQIEQRSKIESVSVRKRGWLDARTTTVATILQLQEQKSKLERRV